MTNPADPTITCPHCKAEVRLTESLAAPLVEATKARFETQLHAEREKIAKSEAEKARLPVHMRRDSVYERARAPVRMSVRVDGRAVLERAYPAKGIWHDEIGRAHV